MVKVHGALSSNDGDIVLGWALDGHGILIRSEWDLAKHLETGHLKLVLPAFTLAPADLFVYYPSRHHLAARVRAFIDFLVAGIGSHAHSRTTPRATSRAAGRAKRAG